MSYSDWYESNTRNTSGMYQAGLMKNVDTSRKAYRAYKKTF